MIRAWAGMTLALFAVCLLVIGGPRLLAQNQPPDRVAALLPDPDCAAPCWQGLRPGYVPPDALKAWIDDPPGNWRASPVYPDVTRVGVIDSWSIPLADDAPLILTTWRVHSPNVDKLFVEQPDLRVGDVVAALGQPAFIDFNLGADIDLGASIEFRLYYPEPSLIVWGVLPVETPILTPDTPVATLAYEALPWGRPLLAFDWRGFGSLLQHYYPQGVVLP
jgi:hypothetical protein